MSEHNKFAFGANEIDGCECPIMAAIGNPDNYYYGLRVAETFDEVVKGKLPNYKQEGVVDEDVAKEAWMDVLNYYEEEAVESGEQVAKDVAAYLDWI